MHIKLKNINNKSGIVMLMVLMVIIIMMILSVSILSSSLNKGSTAQGQVDAIKQEQLAKGLYWRDYSNGNIGVSTVSQYYVVDGKTYQLDVTQPSGTNQPFTYKVSN